MTHGLDTSFLVSAITPEHANYSAAREILARLLSQGDRLAIAPQILAEFIHVTTDSRRFSNPFEVGSALNHAQIWWTAREVDRVFPNSGAVNLFLTWMSRYSLGRKRVLDTLAAATYYTAGVDSLLTANPSDFRVFGVFTCISPSRD